MAVALVVALVALLALGVFAWGQNGALKDLGALVKVAQKEAQDAKLRADAEVRRVGRAAARAEAQRRAAEADLSRALAQLRAASKDPAAKAWLLQPIPPSVKQALEGCKQEGKECP